jgi:hypothetical protein
VALPGACVPASIAQQVIGAWKHVHNEAVVLEEERFMVVTSKAHRTQFTVVQSVSVSSFMFFSHML